MWVRDKATLDDMFLLRMDRFKKSQERATQVLSQLQASVDVDEEE